jgi:hypothetical protein
MGNNVEKIYPHDNQEKALFDTHNLKSDSMILNFRIVWSMPSSKENDYHLLKVVQRFGEENILVNDPTQTYEKFIHSLIYNSFILITSGSICMQMIESIEGIKCLKGICIFCWDIEKHKSWSSK